MRLLLKLSVLGLLALLALGIAAVFFLDRGARIAVEKGVSYALGVPGSVKSVSIRPFSGSVGIEGLSIANPARFSGEPMLAVEHAAMSVRTKSLMSDVVEVPALELSGIRLRLEGRGTKTNYGVILDNLARFETEAKQGEKPSGEAQGSSKRFIIRELVIRDAKVEADYALDASLVDLASTRAAVTLPEIRLKDLGNGKSLSISELSMEIFRVLLEAAASGNLPGLSADISKDLEKNLTEFAEKKLGLDKGVEGALKGLGDLLKKDD